MHRTPLMHRTLVSYAIRYGIRLGCQDGHYFIRLEDGSTRLAMARGRESGAAMLRAHKRRHRLRPLRRSSR